MAKKKPQAAYLGEQQDLNFDAGEAFLATLRAPAQPAAELENRGALRGMADVALAGGRGAVQGVRMLTDLAGADNGASRALRSVEDYISGLRSAQAQQDDQAAAAIMKAAENAGILDQVIAGAKAFAQAPISTLAQAVGTSIPTVAAALMPGAGQVAAAGRMAGALGLGAAQGAGSVKGQIYDEVKQELLQAGASPAEAERRALEASSYAQSGGKIATGAALGAVAGSTGMERAVGALARGVTKDAPGMARRVLGGGVVEAVPEAAQGAQEKLASNQALYEQGFDVAPGAGVVAAGTMEGLAGFGMGAAAGVPRPAVRPGDQLRVEGLQPERGPATRALNAAVEAAAKMVDAGAPMPADPALAAAGDTLRAAAGVATPEPVLQPVEPVDLEQTQSVEPAPAVEPVRTSEPGAIAQREADRPAEPKGEPQAGDILNSQGKPFRNQTAALRALEKAGGESAAEIAVVKGGWVIRPRAQEGAVTDAAAAGGPAVEQPADAGRSDGTGGVRDSGPANLQDGAAAPADQVRAGDGAADVRPGGVGPAPELTHAAVEPATAEAQAAEAPAPAAPAAATAADVPGARAGAVETDGLTGPKIDDEWTAFAPESGTKGVPRAEMPQIKAGDRSSLVQFLRARGIDYQADIEVPADQLKPTQAEFSPGKVAKAQEFTGGDRSILVSSDGHVLDGHHQWVAKRQAGEPVKVIRLDAPIDKLLAEVREFPSAQAAEGAAVASDATDQAPVKQTASDQTWDAMPATDRLPVLVRAGWSEGSKSTERMLKLPWSKMSDSQRTRVGAALGVQPAQDHGAGEAVATSAKSSDQRTAAPVAESQAPAPSEPGDGGVAPTLAGSAPNPKKAKGSNKDAALRNLLVKVREVREQQAAPDPLDLPKGITKQEREDAITAMYVEQQQRDATPKPAANTIFTEDAAAAARARLKAKLGRLNSGIDPEMLMDGITLAGYHIEKGARSFAAYAKAMVDDLGDVVKPYLKSFYNALRDYPGFDTVGMDSYDLVARTDLAVVLREGGNAGLGEPATDRVAVVASLFADLPQRQALVEQGLDSLNVADQRSVLAQVRSGLQDSQVLRAVVESVPVDVMNMLAGQQLAPEQLLSNPAMFTDRLAVSDDGTVSTPVVRVINALLSYAKDKGAFAATEGATSRTDLGRATVSGGAAAKTENGRHSGDGTAVHFDTPAADSGPAAGDGQAQNAAPEATHADPVPAQRLPDTDPAQDRPAAPAGDGDRQPVDAGLAGQGEGPAGGGRVLPGPGGAGEGRAGGAGAVDGKAPRAPRDRAGERAEPGAADDFDLTGEDIGRGGLTRKYRENIAAIKVIKALEAEGRKSTAEERKALARYVGWGALKGVFDPANKQWAKEHAELKALLTEAEWKAALASTRNAHFTSPTVVSAMHEALGRLGVTRGRILEPSVGVGNFFGLMPAQLRKASQLYGVELDPITSKIAAGLYPSATVRNQGFEDFDVPGGFFDVAVGNPPFGEEPIVDMERSPYSGWSIHNYFLAKTIDKLRPGGVMAMVVSHNFLDAQDATARKWIAKHARLISAVRLPRTAFKENAGTDVVTDIVVFERTSAGESDPAWVHVGEQRNTNPKTGDEAVHRVNRYFLDNPDQVLGTASAGGTMYRANEYTVEPNGDLKEQLAAWSKTLPEGLYAPIDRTEKMLAEAVPDGVKVGSFFVADDGRVKRRTDDQVGERTAEAWTPPNEKAAERMKGMVGLRDALRAQMRLETSPDATSEQIEAHRRDLDQRYDAFKKSFGYLNDPTNRRLFLDDTESSLLLALEFDYDKGISQATADREGIDARKPSAKKADILSRRVLFPPQDNLIVSSARDAMLASLNYKGTLDLPYMAKLYGKAEAEIVSELGDLVFKAPDGAIVTADEYLSGDVKTKLAEAEQALVSDAAMKRNVEALRKVIPADKKPSEIHAAMGAKFVPGEVLQEFFKQVTGGTVATAYVKSLGQWVMGEPSGVQPSLNVGRWGTARMPAVKIIEATLAGRTVIVTDVYRLPDGSTRTVVNEKETEAAREKQRALKDEWQAWLWSDAERASRLVKIYNDEMNRWVDRRYDGSHLTLPGKVPDSVIELLPHQKAGVWRALQSRQILLDHVVGAGKTFQMVAMAMEMRRMGIARKPFFAVPNHLTLQWRSEFARMYPAANVLAATPDDFAKGNREKFFSKIVTGDWDAVIVGHSSLKKIALPPDTEKAILEEQVGELADAIEEMKRNRGDRNIVRDMEGIKKRLEAKLKTKLSDLGQRDKVVTFDELGVDAIFVDELHEFKNLYYHSTMDRVPGMGNPTGSDKAFDLFVKVQWLNGLLGDQAPIVGATGTPVSNSLVEMYNMQRFMQYPTLKREGLHVFDAWARQFGSVENVYEVSPSGTGYRSSNRFSKFKNLGALMSHYNSFADVVTLDDLKAQEEARGKRFPVPKLRGGRPQIVVAERSPLVANFMGVPRLTMQGDRVEFGFNPTAGEKVDITEKEGKVTAELVFPTEDGREVRMPMGIYQTRGEAEMKVVEAALSPKITVDPDSILGKFGRLRELTKQTKGKVNALSLTGAANKAGLDFRLVDPAAPDFPGSKINLAVDNMLTEYQRWADDRGTQLVFCDLSVPLSERDNLASKARRLYVREDGLLVHKKGTMHTVEGFEDLPFFLVQSGTGEAKAFTAYDAATGLKLNSGLKTKAAALQWAADTIKVEANRQKWIDARERAGEITQDQIDDYNDANEIDTEETEAITLQDVAGVSGATAFSVYDDIKAKLIARGVPEREIAFIHDYATPTAKDKLFRAVNAGDVRFLLGSTPKMGAGTNVQKRLVALHHIDAPWRPSDLEQREGRIIRRGNELYERDPEGFEIGVYRYATKQTYDTRRWQILEHKARGIEQLRNYDGTLNEIDDIEGEAANAADMKAAASGDPLILQETQLRTDLKRLETLAAGHVDQVQDMRRRANDFQQEVSKWIPQQRAELEVQQRIVAKHPVPAEGLPGGTAVQGKEHTDRKAFTQAIARVVAEAASAGSPVEFKVTYRGLGFSIEGGSMQTVGLTDDRGVTVGRWSNTEAISASGIVQRLANYADRIADRIAELDARSVKYASEAKALIEEAKKPFAQAQELEDTRRQHRNVQRLLIARGPEVPADEKPILEKAQAAQREALRKAGFGDTLDELLSMKGVAASRAGASKGPKIDLASARSFADKLAADGLLRLNVVQSTSDLPAGLLAQLSKTTKDGRVRGAYIRGTDQVWLVADHIRGANEFVEVALHEAFHRGLGKLIPDSKPVLREIWRTNQSVRKLTAEQMRLHGIERDEAIEEALAKMAEAGTVRDLAGWPKLLEAIRSWLAKVAQAVGVRMTWTDDMVADLVAASTREGLLAGVHFDAGQEKLAASRAPTVMRELAENDDLFALPRLSGKNVSEIAFDLDPAIKVLKRSSQGLRETWRVTLPEGGYGDITIRKPNPHGPDVYGFDLRDGEMANVVTERAGENPNEVDPTDDVWIDVSTLKTGQGGNKIYAIAGALAHNTGRIFIGDPNGLSPIAMRRRAENMLSLALRYGTTKFLAPHPDQTKGSKEDGVPPLRWVYGDDEGNAERLIALNIKAMENAFPEIAKLDFDVTTGQFVNAVSGARIDRDRLAGRAAERRKEEGSAGALGRAAAAGRTVARAVVLRALSRQEGGQGQGSGGRAGVLDRLGAAASGPAAGGLTKLFSRVEPAEDAADLRAAPVLRQIQQRANDLLTTQRTFNWWHRTVGTQYHKAQVDRDFGRVYNAAQDYLHDTSAFANDSADLAPDLLPQLKHLGDLKKSLALKKADREALAAAVFEGTLKFTRTDSGHVVEAGPEDTAGVVWTPAELRARFNFTDHQVKLYEQARAAIDRSLDTLVATDVARLLGDMLPGGMRALISTGDLGRFRGMARAFTQQRLQAAQAELVDLRRRHRTEMSAHWRKQKEALEGPGGRAGSRLATVQTLEQEKAALRLRQGGEKYRAEQAVKEWASLEQTVREKFERVDELKTRGYAPLQRFGRYTVDVVGADGMRQFFGLYESQAEANAAARTFREAAEPGDQVMQGVLSEEAYKQFQGLTPETLELFAEVAGVEKNEVFQEYLRRAKNNRSALKRLIHRKGIAGYSEDTSRVLAQFIVSNARAASTNLHMGEMAKAVQDIPREKGDVVDEAIRLREYVQTPQEEAQAIRGMLFAQFLGGSVASAMVNMTQPLMMTLPYLSQFGGPASAARHLAGAVKAALGRYDRASELGKALALAEKEGIVSPQELHQLQAEASGSLAKHPGLRRAMFAWGSLFSAAEQFNRRLSFVAAFNLAKARGMSDAASFAARTVDETQGVYNKGNKPRWARGAVGATVFTFKQYSVSYMEFLKRLPTRERTLALAVLLLAAGAQGMPGADDLDDLVDTLGQGLGYDTNAKLWKTRVLSEAIGADGADFVLRGFSALPGFPLDVAGRLGLGNLVPGTGLLLKSKVDKAGEVAEAIGPAASLASGVVKAVPALASGDVGGVTAGVAPKGIKDLAKALEMYQTGEYRDTKGRKVAEASATDALVKGLGFQPAHIARDSRRVQMANQQIALARATEAEIADAIARARVDGDAEAEQAARRRLARWNEVNPESRIVVTPMQIARRARELRTTRDERFVRAAPREMRQDVAGILQ